MPFANLDDAIAKLRAAASGSASMDADVKSYVGIVNAQLQPTRRVADMLAMRTSGKMFTLADRTAFDADGISFQETGRPGGITEIVTTFGTGPDFDDHVHGFHPTNTILSAIVALLKFREGRRP